MRRSLFKVADVRKRIRTYLRHRRESMEVHALVVNQFDDVQASVSATVVEHGEVVAVVVVDRSAVSFVGQTLKRRPNSELSNVDYSRIMVAVVVEEHCPLDVKKQLAEKEDYKLQ